MTPPTFGTVMGVLTAGPVPLPPVEWDMDIEDTEVPVGAGAAGTWTL